PSHPQDTRPEERLGDRIREGDVAVVPNSYDAVREAGQEVAHHVAGFAAARPLRPEPHERHAVREATQADLGVAIREERLETSIAPREQLAQRPSTDRRHELLEQMPFDLLGPEPEQARRSGVRGHDPASRVAGERVPDRLAQLLRRQADVEVEEVLADDLLASQAPEVVRRAVPRLDAQLVVEDDDTCVEPPEYRLQECVDLVELVRPLVQFVVDRLELFVRRLELLVHRLELFVRRLELFVRRLELLVRRLQLLVGRLQLLHSRLELLVRRLDLALRLVKRLPEAT